MCSIYRLRPALETTLDEIKNSYLWFSRPTEFNDDEDANIIAFSNANENIKEAFDRVFSSHIFLANELCYIGICCFTEFLPLPEKWGKFPRGHNGIFIEYDKNKLEQYFLNKHFFRDCFTKVEYLKNQLLLKSSTPNGYDILSEVDDDGNCIYLSIRGDIENNETIMDQFILKLLSRINIRFEQQKEHRIILSGRRIPSKDSDLKGYQITIPPDSIEYVHIHPDTPKYFVDEIKKYVLPDKIKLVQEL